MLFVLVPGSLTDRGAGNRTVPEALREEAHSLFMELSTVMKEGGVHCLQRAQSRLGKDSSVTGACRPSSPLHPAPGTQALTHAISTENTTQILKNVL